MKYLIFLLLLLSFPLIKAEKNKSIGTAVLLENGNIVMNLVAESGSHPGLVGHSQIVVKPTDKDYKTTLKHIGGLKVGEEKLVPPWPN